MQNAGQQPGKPASTSLAALWRDQIGATTLEYTLMMAGVAIPAMLCIHWAFRLLIAHYRMITTLNALPFP